MYAHCGMTEPEAVGKPMRAWHRQRVPYGGPCPVCGQSDGADCVYMGKAARLDIARRLAQQEEV